MKTRRPSPAFLAPLFAVAVLAGLSRAGEAGSDRIGRAFAPAHPGARLPEAGEWLEYETAFPADPLEQSLAAGAEGGEGPPRAALPPAWTAMRLRLSFLSAPPGRFEAVMTYPGGSRRIAIPWEQQAEGKPDTPPDGEAGAPEQTFSHRLFDRDVSGAVEASGGLVRWLSPEVPFGLVRFASPDFDMILVGFGSDPAPEFPLEGVSAVPPPGGVSGLDGE